MFYCSHSTFENKQLTCVTDGDPRLLLYLLESTPPSNIRPPYFLPKFLWRYIYLRNVGARKLGTKPKALGEYQSNARYNSIENNYGTI